MDSARHFRVASSAMSKAVRGSVGVWLMSCLSPTTEGFYDTASHRSQQASQHSIVYQKETTLPKRRCPRRCKPICDNGANRRGKPNYAPTTKPGPCVKTMVYAVTPAKRIDCKGRPQGQSVPNGDCERTGSDSYHCGNPQRGNERHRRSRRRPVGPCPNSRKY